MAKSLGDSFELAAERYISFSCLLKLILSGNKVMAEAGHKALITILENVTSEKLLLKITNEANSKNPIMRNKCTSYLRCILTNYPLVIIEKCAFNIENMIKCMVNDPSAETRTLARESFIFYEKNFPDRASIIYNNFTIPVQKEVIETKAQQNISEDRVLKK